MRRRAAPAYAPILYLTIKPESDISEFYYIFQVVHRLNSLMADPDNSHGNGGVDLKMGKRAAAYLPDPDDLDQHESSLSVVDGRLSILFVNPADASPAIHHTELPTLVDVLKCDSVDMYRNLSTEQRYAYLHGRFDYTTSGSLHAHKESSSKLFEIPLNLAVGFGATNIVEEMIKVGVDLTRLDIDQENILHVLAVSCSQRRHAEETYTNICNIIINGVSPGVLKLLCEQENAHGNRPLELASKLGTFGIFRSILLKPGYLCGEPHTLGLSTLYPYDLSDYEGYNDYKRFLRSPLRFLEFLKNDAVESLQNYNILNLPVIKKWIALKMRCTIFILIVWWVIRLTYLGMMSFVDPTVIVFTHMCSDFNRSSSQPDKGTDSSGYHQYQQCLRLDTYSWTEISVMLAIQRAIQIFSGIMLAIDSIEVITCLLIKDRRTAYRGLYLNMDFTTYTHFYRVAQFILYLVGLTSPLIAITQSAGRSYEYLLYMKTIVLPLTLFSFMYIVEFLPVLGIFAITLQKIIKNLSGFMVFFLPVKLIFAQFFTIVASGDGFSNLSEGTYQLFLMDMGAFDFAESPMMIIKIVHVFYFLMMGILLFNYLIALLSTISDSVSERRQIFVALRRLQMMNLAEERMYWVWKVYYAVKGRRPVILRAPCPR